MKNLVAKVAPFLSIWTIYNTTFARQSEPGLWQVIDFGLDKYITSQRFTIELGIHDVGVA